jgi:hypothetical protein
MEDGRWDQEERPGDKIYPLEAHPQGPASSTWPHLLIVHSSEAIVGLMKLELSGPSHIWKAHHQAAKLLAHELLGSTFRSRS